MYVTYLYENTSRTGFLLMKARVQDVIQVANVPIFLCRYLKKRHLGII